MGFLFIPLIAALSAADLERIIKYDNLQIQRSAEAKAEARRAFAGRGEEVVEQFLKHGEYPPSNGAYIFVLSVLGDIRATLQLIRALPDPPQYETGPAAKYGMGRDFGEIRWAVEAILENSAELKKDPRVVRALVEAVATAKARPKGIAIGNAGAAVSLLALCEGPAAVEALQTFAADAEPSLRALAVQALGKIGVEAGPPGPQQVSALATLARTLRSDPHSEARLQAAVSLGDIKSPQAAESLIQALKTEQDPRVIDAIAIALRNLRVLLPDPAAARAVVERCWEPAACTALFEQWRASVDGKILLDAAVRGAPVLRALSLAVLTAKPAPSRKWASLLPEPQPPPVRLDPDTQSRLLTSIVELLGHEVTAFPKQGKEISYGTAQLARDALWEASGRDLGVALTYADRIVPVSFRYTGSGRYGASVELQRRDAKGYRSYRRPRQLMAAVLLALPFTLLFIIVRSRRRAAVMIVASLLAWGAWSLFMQGVRELPPPPLYFLTVSFIAFTSAGVISAALLLLPQIMGSWRRLRELGRAAVAIFGAMFVAFGVCAWTRGQELFPIGGEGWELLFDPLGSAILAGGVAFLLSILDVAIFGKPVD